MSIKSNRFKKEYIKYSRLLSSYYNSDMAHIIILYTCKPPMKIIDEVLDIIDEHLYYSEVGTNIDIKKFLLRNIDFITNPHALDFVIDNIEYYLKLDNASFNKFYYKCFMHNIGLNEYFIVNRPELVNWEGISRYSLNINYYAEIYTDKIYWPYLSNNPAAIETIKKHPEKIDWRYLSANPAAIDILKENPEKIDWDMLSGNINPRSIDLLFEQPEKINWWNLSGNHNVDLLKTALLEQPDKICWYNLSANPNAIDLLKEQPDKICWFNLSRNPNIELLEQNQDLIKFDMLRQNPNPKVLDLMIKNIDKIDIDDLLDNPAIFEVDKKYIRRCKRNSLC